MQGTLYHSQEDSLLNCYKQAKEFNSWLENRSPDEYWSGAIIHDSYARNTSEHLKEKAKKGSLKASHFTWYATNKCNLFCDHCGQRSGKALENELSQEEFLSLIDDLKAIGIQYISISGGEPFLRFDLFDIIKRLKEEGFKVGVISNGFITNKEVLENILNADLDAINVSIDGTQEVHDRIRGREGSYQRILQFLKDIQELKCHKAIVSTVHPENIHRLKEIEEDIFKLGINSWLLRPIAPTGRAKEQSYGLSDNEIHTLIDYNLNALKRGLDVSIAGDAGYLGEYDSILRSSAYFNSTGWNSFHLGANGDVKGIHEEDLPLEANIRDIALKDIWNNKFKSYRNPEVPDYCSSCDYYAAQCPGESVENLVIGHKCWVARGAVK